jgi:hypothetical protein
MREIIVVPLYILQSARREVKLMWGVLWCVSSVIPTALASRVGAESVPLLYKYADIIPRWGWVIAAIIAALGGLILAIAARAMRLEERLKAKIEVAGLDVYEFRGMYFVRVNLFNNSDAKIVGAKCVIRRIKDDNGLLDDMHAIIGGDLVKLRFPVQLMTSERLKERIDGGQKHARRFDFDPHDDKNIEIVQFKSTGSFDLYLFDADDQHILVTPSDISFECRVTGEMNPVEFFLRFEQTGSDPLRIRIVLSNAAGTIIDEKTFTHHDGRMEEDIEQRQVPKS